MGRIESNRTVATVLFKTLQRLEADPAVDPRDPAFIRLKSDLLQRLLSFQLDTVETQSNIHLVESPKSEIAESTEADNAFA